MIAARIVIAFINVYTIVLFIRILFSWAPPEWRANEFYEFLHAVTEPVMRPFRRIIPPMGGIDFSAILLFIVLAIVARLMRGLM